jgi:hypothetical protein
MIKMDDSNIEGNPKGVHFGEGRNPGFHSDNSLLMMKFGFTKSGPGSKLAAASSTQKFGIDEPMLEEGDS